MPGKLNRIRKYKWRKRLRTHGFLKKMKSQGGRNLLSRRRAKGRHVLTVTRKGR